MKAKRRCLLNVARLEKKRKKGRGKEKENQRKKKRKGRGNEPPDYANDANGENR